MLQDSPQDVLFQCKDCGTVSDSIGELHAHIEAKHTGFGPFNIIPNPFRIGRGDKDMEETTVLRVTETEEIQLSEVDGFA